MAATAPAPTAAVLPLYAEKASPVGMDAQPASAAPSSGLPSVAAALDQQLVNVTSRLGVRPDQVEGAKYGGGTRGRAPRGSWPGLPLTPSA